MHRRPARRLLALALSTVTAASLAGAVGAQAHARTPTHAGCAHVRRALSHDRHQPGSLVAECTGRKHKKTRSHGVRLLLHGSGHGPRAGIRPPAPHSSSGESSEATIAEVLATPCTGTEVTPEPADMGVVREAVLCLVNQERASHGEQPLRNNPKLQAAAESHSAECVELDYFAHVSPSGETPVERIQDTGYIPSPFDGYVLGENLAWGTYELSTPKSIVAAWIASPPHLANILESRYTETGIGVAPAVPSSRGEGAPGATYAQEFGVIIT